MPFRDHTAESAQVSHCPRCGRSHVVVGLDSTLLETRPTLRPHACGVGGPGSAEIEPSEAGCPGLCGEHHWLDRPESDTRECLICGTEVAG